MSINMIYWEPATWIMWLTSPLWIFQQLKTVHSYRPDFKFFFRVHMCNIFFYFLTMFKLLIVSVLKLQVKTSKEKKSNHSDWSDNIQTPKFKMKNSSWTSELPRISNWAQIETISPIREPSVHHVIQDSVTGEWNFLWYLNFNTVGVKFCLM